MKIVVPVKRVVDYNVKVRVKPDGLGVDTENVKHSLNPFDEIAVEEAIRLKEQGVASEVVVVSVGLKKSEDIIRTSLAMGADKGILVEVDNLELQPLGVAKILTKIVEKEQPKLVIMGKQAIDDDANQTGQMLAGMLDWPQATFASKIKIADKNAENIEVTREVDGGLMIVKNELPAVVTVDLRLNKPRYVQLTDIMKAKSKSLEKLMIADLAIAEKDIEPRLQTLKVEDPPKRSRGKILESVEELAEEIKKLDLGV